jgi:heptosyltransferase III
MELLPSAGKKTPPAVPGRGHRYLRKVDKYAGVPVVFCLGMLRGRRILPQPIRRIGLLNTAAIGDTVLMSACVADVRSAYADTEITMLVGPSNYEAARLMDPTGKVVKLPVFDPITSIREVRQRNFDVLIDFGSWARLNAVVTGFSQAKFTAGFRTKGEYRHYVYDKVVDHSAQLHELTNYRNLLSALNIPSRNRPRVAPSQIPPIAKPTWREPYLVFHLWPGGTAAILKQWPVERWVKLAEHFAASGFHIVLTGGPTQKIDNDKVIDAVSPKFAKAVHNQAGLSLAATAAAMAGSVLVVSVDTGVMHLAAALDVPLVALMGPACQKRWGPVGGPSSVLESPLKGCGYLNLGFEIPNNPPKCMEAISFDAVRAACEKSLVSDSVRLGGLSV